MHDCDVAIADAQVFYNNGRIVVKLPPEYQVVINETYQRRKKTVLNEDGSLNLAALTSRQRDVLTIIIQGKSNKEIANVLNITERTVKFHVSDLIELLKVSNRLEMIFRFSNTVIPIRQAS